MYINYKKVQIRNLLFSTLPSMFFEGKCVFYLNVMYLFWMYLFWLNMYMRLLPVAHVPLVGDLVEVSNIVNEFFDHAMADLKKKLNSFWEQKQTMLIEFSGPVMKVLMNVLLNGLKLFAPKMKLVLDNGDNDLFQLI